MSVLRLGGRAAYTNGVVSAIGQTIPPEPRRASRPLALALPEHVRPAQEWVLARPTGVGRAISTYTIPIEGRDEWLAAARRLA